MEEVNHLVARIIDDIETAGSKVIGKETAEQDADTYSEGDEKGDKTIFVCLNYVADRGYNSRDATE